MKVAVWGDGHLAEATAYHCRAQHELVDRLSCDVLWFCSNSELLEDETPDVPRVMREMAAALSETEPHVLMLVSTQLPVGTCRKWEDAWSPRRFAVQPENIRIAHATEDFAKQPRMVVGLRGSDDAKLISELLAPFTKRIIFMSPESAEMSKHALNTFLALNIAYANEIGDLCRANGAEMADVIPALLTDRRVSDDAPIWPGRGFSGGTLGRDVAVLTNGRVASGPIIKAITPSNQAHL